jgi:hypothetical protein
MTLDQSRRAICALNIAMQELTAAGFDEKSDVCKHLFEAQIAADVCHQLMVCDIMREAETYRKYCCFQPRRCLQRSLARRGARPSRGRRRSVTVGRYFLIRSRVG